MKVLTKTSELREALAQRPRGTVGLVPTMGALHNGHRSLIERCRRECDTVVVTDFVNPTQFNDKNDLRNYPRTLESDCLLAEAAGADILFAPTVEEVYPEPDNRTFPLGGVGEVMEGASRPGHFNGVCQVVSRLFVMTNPDRAYFGEKDFQQIAVIKAMVRLEGFKIQIVECPIVREADGLALSSRNRLLDAPHRTAAPHIFEVLSAAQQKVGELSPSRLEAWVTGEIERNPLLKVVYFNIVDSLSMQRVGAWDDATAVQGCITVQAGAIRLIDNIKLK
ncbi:MAG: pantoate--beta-alanine ligase [Tidjanibacter sp.]|nr:pantoate--beta-alanine ligase [Tidjanibacter sp.]